MCGFKELRGRKKIQIGDADFSKSIQNIFWLLKIRIQIIYYFAMANCDKTVYKYCH